MAKREGVQRCCFYSCQFPLEERRRHRIRYSCFTADEDDRSEDRRLQISADRDWQIERFGDLGRDSSQALRDVLSRLSPGDTELEVAAKIRYELAKYELFPVVTLVGADERIERYRHPVPTSNVWNKTLLIAVCARRHGLIASLSRLICVGDVPSELERRTQAVAIVNAKLQAATITGANAIDLYRTAAFAYAELGFASEIDKHHQGGACGYRTRDWVAHPENPETVRSNQAYAWNSSITGTKAEVTGVVRSDGFESITPAGGFPQIVTRISGREYFSPGVLSLSKGAAA